ncbi:hypothetical protein BH09GEM1_BH09GEM1_44320 [soil metagenome]
MIRGLVHAEIDFVVIGGVAAAAHGSALVTNDLDICYRPSAENVERLAALLGSWHAYLRGVDRGLPFIMDARAIRTSPILTLETDEGFLDVLDVVAGVGDYARVIESSDVIRAFDVELRMLSLPALIAAKRAAARPKDLAHLPELEALLASRTLG